jgi:hypothetical protein
VNDELTAMVKQMTKRLTDEGRLIEAGWQTMRIQVVPPTASDVQLTEMRKAYFAGAQHLFASIMTVMGEDGGEPTAEDLHRLDLIDQELRGFVEELLREIERPT